MAEEAWRLGARQEDLCKVTVHMLVINRMYLDNAWERTLWVEGLTIDDHGTPQYVRSIWQVSKEDLGTSGVLAQVQLGALLELRSSLCSFEPHRRPETVWICLRDPDYSVVAPAALDPGLLDMLYDHLDDHVRDEEVFDLVRIDDEWMESPMPREQLLIAIADSWRGDPRYKLMRTQDVQEKQVANKGNPNVKTIVSVGGFDDKAHEIFKSMALCVKNDLDKAIAAHPDWFNVCPEGLTASEGMVATLGIERDSLAEPIVVLPRGCRTPDDQAQDNVLAFALITDKEFPGGRFLPRMTVPEGCARHSILLSFPNRGVKCDSLVRLSLDNPLTHSAIAISDMTKAYLFPEAVAMNDYAEMRDALAWGTAVYSLHEFDLRWGGVHSVIQAVKASLVGKGNTFAVLSYPMDGFDAEMPHTLSVVCEAAKECLNQNATFLLSCSLNVLNGRTARLSLFARIPEGERG